MASPRLGCVGRSLAQISSDRGTDGATIVAGKAVVVVGLAVPQQAPPHLATVRDVRLLWTFDEVISASNPAVANSARRQFLKTDRGAQPLDLSPTALQSPGRFAAFAAETMFAPLPAR